jgi:hypothetical protein
MDAHGVEIIRDIISEFCGKPTRKEFQTQLRKVPLIQAT